ILREEEKTVTSHIGRVFQLRRITPRFLVWLLLGAPVAAVAGVLVCQGPLREALAGQQVAAPEYTTQQAEAPVATHWPRPIQQAIDAAHAACFDDDPFPSAKKCQKCHEGHFREWSVSPHAYAQLSPVFNAMSNALIKLTNGTTGDFCIRCHTPVGMAQNEPI